MAGKPSLKSDLIEEAVETLSILKSFQEDVGEIQDLINQNEEKDHKNDKARAEVQQCLLKALECLSMAAYAEANKYLHAAIQRLNTQDIEDRKDDDPRSKAQLKIAVTNQKAFNSQEKVEKILEKIQQSKKVGA